MNIDTFKIETTTRIKEYYNKQKQFLVVLI